MTQMDTAQGKRAASLAAAFRNAIDLAAAHEGATAPNPCVGCVLLDAGGETLAAAAHLGAGQAHAEARAIAMAQAAGVAGRIATVVVTLEPCDHHGHTGPCSDAILATPAREVWYGLLDPNSNAAGGAERLRRAGLTVRSLAELRHAERDRLLTDATRLLAPFATRVRLGRPFVTVKQAVNISGSMIPNAGQKTFTGPDALRLAHRLRRRADAILTGSGTILADRPEFTVRHLPDIPGKSRILCILDRRGRVDAAYLSEAQRRGFRTRIESDLVTALHALGDAGCNEVLVEAGPTLLSTVRQDGLWDEWVLIEAGAAGQSDRITCTNRNHQAR
ncbi:MAG: bifunctional diaminohydroxyphosphoribosylaminopyrimidine deaminase/5-amino-6-(5-phosphoribosylamino)uracil reductase RibD [Alphaproteobacteria bacterium]